MSKFLSNLRRFLTRSKIPSSYGGSIDTNFSKFQEGDVVIINGRNPLLTKALGRNKQTGVSRGVIQHNDIIGRRPRDLVKAQKGPSYRITFPTLDEYATLSPRLVTPVYPADANLIVSLLDIHTSVPSDQREPDQPVEILEAGTVGKKQKVSKREGQQISDESSLNQEAWDSWRSGRRAIIHTVEISAKHSAHAEKIIRGFRRGMYAGNIDFYVASVENWIEEQTRRRNRSLFSGTLEPFLSYAILDMPSAHLRIPHVSPILKVDGVLAVFMPNVTQIGDCVKIINDKRLPLVLEKAVELGTGISSGRLWDIRMAVRRSRPVKTKEAEQPTGGENGEESSGEVSESKTQDVYTSALAGEPQAGDPVLVCRPKVGERIVGGGFVGLWRRINEQ
uniref:tRNA (adenine(58)-N(1))-methyltransferase catalytic subunit TRM61 n=1 Tax=Coccidioides posadasii RMSCC 3488 TaxID=454284 RepID=A0A0J6I3J3_COCPO|nr:tRNA (adenine-N(1)-)-methyltransferase [Coccidioides posadasii RMSCC 3488]